MNKDKYSNVVLLVDPSPPHNSILQHYRFTFIEKKEEGDVGFCFSDKDFWDNNQINRFMYLYKLHDTLIKELARSIHEVSICEASVNWCKRSISKIKGNRPDTVPSDT